ncbi:hypothetical protein G5B40_01340 [Pikeienuella piscinae]|uniref:Uncharacterized protein n=1 Tax=Pikeienuella piscinae TaxID=2748098 RepID=A0A7L5BWE8_9RHOB|nr:hypothetical protein [Pikeienuella piscinae]QIE54204.1 hypothetical protein G5B40_01340 [Pikeienuella piscinae]
MAVDSLRAGAIGFPEKPHDGSKLLTRIGAAMRAVSVAGPEQLFFRRRFDGLTPCEMGVIVEAVAGHSCKAAAHRLGRGAKTVQNHWAL